MKLSALAFALAIAVVCAPTSARVEIPLREAARNSRILIGTAVRPAHLSELDYASTLAREFNMLEPEDALKWEIIHPDPNAYDFSQADRAAAFAFQHAMKLRGHTLVWHRQNPTWLTDGNFSSAALTKILEQHIKTVVGHYRGRIFAWDVVNEAFDEITPGELRSTIWSNQPGIIVKENTAGSDQQRATNNPAHAKLEARSPRLSYSYIERCFRWAHEADPQALLFYNDAEAEGINPKSDAIFAMVSDFRKRGVPIDGLGLQMHVPHLRADIPSISANIKRITDLGLQVHITELDIALPVDASGDASPQDLKQQAELYRQIATTCLSYPGCTAIQAWGFTDKYSWIGSHSQHQEGNALLFDSTYRPKPSYDAMKDALLNAPRR
jgi:endo-1,4-beta-xylanase